MEPMEMPSAETPSSLPSSPHPYKHIAASSVTVFISKTAMALAIPRLTLTTTKRTLPISFTTASRHGPVRLPPPVPTKHSRVQSWTTSPFTISSPTTPTSTIPNTVVARMAFTCKAPSSIMGKSTTISSLKTAAKPPPMSREKTNGVSTSTAPGVSTHSTAGVNPTEATGHV